LFYKLFGKRGLFVWVFNSFFNHWHSKVRYGEKETENAVLLGYAALISLSVIVQGVLFFTPKIVFIPRIALGNNYFHSIALLGVYGSNFSLRLISLS
jgi:uncharacterized PurR-regulated membrane protein YhhQ (DUF165 family)